MRIPMALPLAIFLIGPFAANARAQESGGGLGSKDPSLFCLKGTIYALEDDTERMPANLASRRPLGTIYATQLDVPARDFESGFPGVTDRFEWFGILYAGQFQADVPGSYHFRLSSDDGSRLWIDDKEVIDNDGIHGENAAEADVELTKGVHTIRVWYFQGPRVSIALQLFVTPPKGKEKIFSLADYSSGLARAAKSIRAVAGPDGIKVQLDAAVLFDTGKYVLKPKAKTTLKAVAEVLSAYPGATVEISGHTDSVGDDASNQKLSEDRAAAVKTAIVAVGLPATLKLEAVGHGETRPIAPNEDAKGRAKNRRVEILIRP